MSVTTKNLLILAWLYLILCVCPSLAQRSGSNNDSDDLTPVYFVLAPVGLLIIIIPVCCCFVCLLQHRRRLALARPGTQRIWTPHGIYLHTTTAHVQPQAQHDTLGTPAGNRCQPTTAQPDHINSALQDALPPPYEAARNHSPPSSSAVFDDSI